MNRILKKKNQKKRRQLCKTNYEMEWGEKENDLHVWLTWKCVELRNEFRL